MQLTATEAKVRVRLGTTLTDMAQMLTSEAPVDMASMRLKDLAYHVLSHDYEGPQGQLATNVQRILASTSWGRRAYVIEVAGQPADPKKPVAEYLSRLSAAGADGYQTLDIRVSSRDGGGSYQSGRQY